MLIALKNKDFRFITKDTFIEEISSSKINDFTTKIYLVSIDSKEGLIPFKGLTKEFLEKEFLDYENNQKIISFINRISSKKIFKKQFLNNI